MDILDQNKLLLFIFFVIPGIVALKTYEAFYGRPKNDLTQEITNAVFLSCLNYAVCGAPVIYFLENFHLSIWNITFLGILVLLLAPCILCMLWIWATNFFYRKFAKGRTLEKSPWDYFFKEHNTEGKWIWAEVMLNDGTKLHGVFGHATSYPDEPQIYLKEFWYLDNENNKFVKDDGDLGIVILSKDIKYVNFKSLT
ncbi:DUF6338 family protein [Acinetobacter pittii]|uniref:DUF6338 family protein n=1 Tax=Acinetobacter pittii TaxID=48296 RepID=UPI001EE5A434|nr:DUF6338 family protein [Acinetobacter pittii]MCG5255833.1 DUF6338 family protein [Acinetobacter pittii]